MLKLFIRNINRSDFGRGDCFNFMMVICNFIIGEIVLIHYTTINYNVNNELFNIISMNIL